MEDEIKIINFSKGTVIIVENTTNEGYFYILQSGIVNIQSDVHFYDKAFGKYREGDTFGLVSGLTKNPTRHTLIADEDCKVIRIPINLLGKYFHDNRDICLKIISLYSNQLRYLNNYLITKDPGHHELENPANLLEAGEVYAKQNETDIAACCLYKYIEWAKENQSGTKSIKYAKDLLNKISPEYTHPVYNTNILDLKKNDIIFVENEPADFFYIIQKGAIKISKLVNDQEFILCILREGEIFGEMAILNKKVRNASAIVFDDAEILQLPVDTFIDEIGEKLLIKIFNSFARRIWYAHQRAALLEMYDPNAMLYAYLQILISDFNTNLKSAKKIPDEYIFNFSINDLKKMVGLGDVKDAAINDFLTDINIEISRNTIHIISRKKIDDKVTLYKGKHRKKQLFDMPVK